MASPIEQFEIKPLFSLGHIGGHEIAFTNSSLYMVDRAWPASRALMLGATVVAQALVRPHRSRSPNCPTNSSPDTLQLERRPGRHEVLPAGVLAVHVHPDG